jgi:hypothetical protein
MMLRCLSYEEVAVGALSGRLCSAALNAIFTAQECSLDCDWDWILRRAASGPLAPGGLLAEAQAATYGMTPDAAAVALSDAFGAICGSESVMSWIETLCMDEGDPEGHHATTAKRPDGPDAYTNSTVANVIQAGLARLPGLPTGLAYVLDAQSRDTQRRLDTLEKLAGDAMDAVGAPGSTLEDRLNAVIYAPGGKAYRKAKKSFIQTADAMADA